MSNFSSGSNIISGNLSFIGTMQNRAQSIACTFSVNASNQQSQALFSSLLTLYGVVLTTPLMFFFSDTFSPFFGAGFSQNLDRITIQKSSLPGLNVLPVNTAESLFVGLLLQWFNSTVNDTQGEIQVRLWRINLKNSKQISTFILDLYNKFPVNDYVTDYSSLYNSINPNNY